MYAILFPTRINRSSYHNCLHYKLDFSLVVVRPSSQAIVRMGENIEVVCNISASIIAPYADRPTEGSINFSVSISMGKLYTILIHTFTHEFIVVCICMNVHVHRSTLFAIQN